MNVAQIPLHIADEHGEKCLGCGGNVVCSSCGRVMTFRWNWGKFWRGKLSNKFIAFTVFTVLGFIVLFRNHSEYGYIIMIGLIIVTVIYMLSGAIDTAVSNMKIEAALKAGASVDKRINKEIR